MVISTSFSYGRNGSDILRVLFSAHRRLAARFTIQCAFVISPLRVDRAHRPHNETSREALPMCYGVLAGWGDSNCRRTGPYCGTFDIAHSAGLLPARSSASPIGGPGRYP